MHHLVTIAGANDGKIIHARRQVREQVGDFNPAFAMFLEAAFRPQQFCIALDELILRFAKLGRSLTASVTDYNAFISSLETRVLVTARKLDAVDESKLIESAKDVDDLPRRLVADELTSALEAVERPELDFAAASAEIPDENVESA